MPRIRQQKIAILANTFDHLDQEGIFKRERENLWRVSKINFVTPVLLCNNIPSRFVTILPRPDVLVES